MRLRYWMMRPLRRGPSIGNRGGFIYVLRADAGRRKIGISCDPNRRISELQTAHPLPLTFEYIGALNCDGFAIEDGAHSILARYHMNGDWFSCPLDIAIAAISVASARLGQPIASVDPARIDEIVAAVSWRSAPWSIKRALTWCYLIIVAAMIGVAVLAFIMGRA